MSEKRFVQVGDTSIKDTLTGEKYYAPCEDGLLELLNEQQATIEQLQEENKELGKNFTDLVEWASEIAKRNVLLDEKIGKIQQAIRIAYEKKPYPTIEDIQKEINNE